MTDGTLAGMAVGAEAIVQGVSGGSGVSARLETMGIRPGVRITKVSGQRMEGPITVRVGSSHIALGFGMASRIAVSVVGPAS